MEFERDFDNALIYKEYCERDNYRCENFNVQSHRCIIFFSANSLYTPDNPAEFQKRIIMKDLILLRMRV